jgi:phospholipid/cholesterol/gamma-HCH transport system substrate-binding protein
MNGKSPELKVGLLVLVALVGLVYMSLKVGGAGTGILGGGGYRVYLPMENASGLLEGGDVMVAGIRVGQVEKIALDDGNVALATLFIRDEVALPDDSTAILKTRGVLGEVFVSLRPGRSTVLMVDQSRLTPGESEGDITKMVQAVHDVASNLSKVTERLARVLGTDEGEAQMRNIVTDVEGTVAELREIVSENRESLRAALTNFGEASASVRNLIEQNRRDIDETLANARE